VKLVSLHAGSPLLEFTTMLGRSYTVLGSPDLRNWTALSFQIPAEGSSALMRSYYYAPDIRTLQVQAIQPAAGPQMLFFRLLLQ